ncbi:hypothetical protein XENTR_v10003424 [Xenopus tropicalis]|nr:hypothetical protein XENTR_v10003424 [Xenopus tropicalis]
MKLGVEGAIWGWGVTIQCVTYSRSLLGGGGTPLTRRYSLGMFVVMSQWAPQIQLVIGRSGIVFVWGNNSWWGVQFGRFPTLPPPRVTLWNSPDPTSRHMG